MKCKYCGNDNAPRPLSVCASCWEVATRLDGFVATHAGRLRVFEALERFYNKREEPC